jgi:hypothetical protein
MPEGQAFTLRQRVLHQVVDGEAVLLDMETGQYYGLNSVATSMWSVLVAGGDFSAVRQALLEEFDAPIHDLDEDIRAFIGEMTDLGLLVPAGNAAE